MINLGFFSIHIYSICILLAVFVSYKVIISESVRHKINEDEMSDLLFYVIVFGIVGARIYYCLFNLDYYSDILSIFKVWEGGLAIHGGLLFGLITILVYCKKRKKNVLFILDFIVIGLIIAQAIGRWGNFFNAEAHGPVTTLAYLKSLYLPNFIIKGMYIDGNYYVPTFLYESLWCLLGFIVMFIIRKKSFMKAGYLTSFYFIWYGTERFFVEGLRMDSLMLGSFKVAQIVSIIMILSGIVLFIYSFKKSPCYNESGRNDIYD